MEKITRLVLIIFLLYCIFIFSSIPERKYITTPQRIVAIGDSLTWGYKVEEPYTDILSNLLERPVKNCGLYGASTYAMLSKIEKNISKGDIVIYLAGANDFREKSSEETIENISRAMSMLENNQVIIMTVPPSDVQTNEGNVRRREVNEYIRSLGNKNNITVLDLCEIFSNYNGSAIRVEYHLSGVHPNQVGYYRMAVELYKIIKTLDE